MIQIGDYATLEVVKAVDFGLYLDGGPYGEILLPLRYVPEGVQPGDELDVFIYNDSEDRVIATTEKPKAKVDEFAYLEVKAVGEYGAFLDWGLPKDLFVPFKEQHHKMQKGQSYLVKIYLDEKTDRIVASSRWHRFLKEKNEDLSEGEEVEIKIADQTDLGYKVIINDTYQGLLYENEIFETLKTGDTKKAYVKNIREDQRIDISLQKQGVAALSEAAQRLLKRIEAEKYLPLTDKSPPELIYEQMKMSKKAFKKAVGILYKRRLIRLEKDGIRLASKEGQ